MRRALVIVVLAGAIAGIAATSAWAVNVVGTCVPGPADCSGWHRTTVRIHWTATPDATSTTCNAVETVAQEGVSNRSCTVTGAGPGDKVTRTVTVRIDWTPPTVIGATPSRPPDLDGWYRSPVDVSFYGNDLTSGIASCATIAYGGPDAALATVTGTCTDNAGNVSPAGSFPLRYDSTPPAVRTPTAATGDAVVRVRWSPPPDATSVEVIRAPGRRGAASSVVHRGPGTLLVDHHVRNGRRYAYTLRAEDAAGNVAAATATAVPGRRLIAPVGGARVTAPPRLSWTKVRRARYYNVQLFHAGRKVLSAWPHHARLSLHRSWRYAGRRHRLRPGRYRWYVWPGRGRRSDRRFGSLIGRAEFVVRHR